MEKRRDYGSVIGEKYCFETGRLMVKRCKTNSLGEKTEWFPAPTPMEKTVFEDGDGKTVADALEWLSRLPQDIYTECLLNVEGKPEIHAPDGSNPAEIAAYLEGRGRDQENLGLHRDNGLDRGIRGREGLPLEPPGIDQGIDQEALCGRGRLNLRAAHALGQALL